MTEEVKVSEVIEEIKNSTESELKETIEKWYEQTRTDGIKIGAKFISAAVMGAIDKNLKSGMNSSHRDFERAIKRIIQIVSVQLNQQETIQNDSQEQDVVVEGDQV